ncbi:MAG: site-specific integrase [Clostridiales bacterium]|nr:site-specific integrase [Clostridiales bacterium]
MAGKRKDSRGRNLRTGEYFDSKNNRYMFRKMVDGARVTISAANLTELRKQENDLLSKIDKGVKFDTKNNKVTLNDYFDLWWENYAKSGRKATTCTNYKSYYNTYIRGTIGKKKITKVTKLDCQTIINKMIADDKKHSTMSNLKSCLNIVFECAVDDDIILKNPAKNLQIPNTESKKRVAVEKPQIDIFMDFVKNSDQYNDAYPMFVVLFNSGARIGEVAALTWDDVDFTENTITINKTVNRYRKTDYGFTVGIASPKSKTSVRRISMNSVIRKTLLVIKMRGTHNKARLPFVDDSGHVRGHITNFIFTNSYGNVWCEPAFCRLIKRIVEAQNREAEIGGGEKVNYFCPHSARHSFTSLAYSAGMDVKAVSQVLGHASVSVTLDTYTHLTEEKLKEQEEAIQRIKIS